MPKKILAITIILATILGLVISIFSVEIVNANPVAMYGQKPKYATIAIDSPIYSSQLSFSIQTNDYWATGLNLSDTHCFVILNNCTYEVNNLFLVSNVTIKDDYAYEPYIQYTLKSTTELSNITSLPSGTYDLKVDYGYYNSEYVNRIYKTQFISLGTATSNIGITQDMTPNQPTASASPALVSDSQEPTSTQSQSLPTVNEGPIGTAGLNTILAVVIALVAVASVSLVYFKRRRGKI